VGVELYYVPPPRPHARRPGLDTTLRRLILLLPADGQLELALQFIQSRRKSRRWVGIQLLVPHFRPEHKQVLLDCHRRTGDERALTALTRVDADLTDVADMLLVTLGDRYKHGRVFEKLIRRDLARAEELSATYPFAFVWGAGRARLPEALPVVLRLLEERRHNLHELGLFIWCLGRLGAKPELQRLAQEYAVTGH
jgi:hypothetical protein